MSMEKRGTTSQFDLRELVKQANDEEIILVIGLNGRIKYASGKDKEAVAVIATGDRAALLREFVDKVSS